MDSCFIPPNSRIFEVVFLEIYEFLNKTCSIYLDFKTYFLSIIDLTATTCLEVNDLTQKSHHRLRVLKEENVDNALMLQKRIWSSGDNDDGKIIVVLN